MITVAWLRFKVTLMLSKAQAYSISSTELFILADSTGIYVTASHLALQSLLFTAGQTMPDETS